MIKLRKGNDMNKYYLHIITILGFLLSLHVFTSCTDEIDAPGYVKEGENAKVSLKIDLDEISIKSRADLSDDLKNRVESLWVGIYNASTGERTFSGFYNPDTDFPEETSKFGDINDIETKSGNSYIVAVANYDNAAAVDLTDKSEKTLYELLEAAGSWDKYRAIAIKQRMYGENVRIEVPAEAIVMQGSYRESGHTGDYTEDESVATVGIQPGSNNLTGKIHLRRIWTQNKFVIKPSDDIISMELIDLKVMNVPTLTWLHGRQQDDNGGTLGYANAGDAYNPTPNLEHEKYLNSVTYTPASMKVTLDDQNRPNYAFDYWQYENKRTGSDSATDYAKREEEKKNSDGSNTGIYTSLCDKDGNLSLDNNATYIRFTAKITYIADPIPTPDDIVGEFAGETVKYRTALATYVVHLGYIGDDPKDFNCYRNSQYTYNITVKSVNQILLEAFKKGENQPGAEGAVTDVTDQFFELDAHFNVFNIYFTKTELANFTFLMTSYEDNVAHSITNIDDPDNGLIENVPTKGDENWKYYSWVQLIKNGNTNEKTKIAKFPKLKDNGTPENPDDVILYLNDIRSLAADLKDDEGLCFTVYVKEYTYEADFGETDYGLENRDEAANRDVKWTHYVNQPSRSANFNVAYKVSSDKESQHFKSKYAFSQRSIQTYYDIAAATSGHGTALGVEHVNEVFGMNIRWTKDAPTGGYSADNGRYNVWIGLGGVNNGTTAGNWDNTNSDPLDLNSLLSVNAITNKDQIAYATHLNTDAATRFVPAMHTITSGLTGTAGLYNGPASNQDPQISATSTTTQYIEAIYSCMNRNKDENGDGIIQAEELKWYVPAAGKYLRVILGRNNLVTPLMNYEQQSLPQGSGSDFNTLYHFISSDRKIVWAEEGMSSSMFDQTGSSWSHAPWQVRCIRNLGTNLKTVSEGEKVTPAYDDTHVDKTGTRGGVIKPTRYFGGALRNPTTDPIPPHKTSEPYNRLATYGFEIAPAGNGNTEVYDREAGLQVVSYNDNGTVITEVTNISRTYDGIKTAILTASPCEKLNKTTGRKGWRIPNQKEIVIMMRAGVIHTGATNGYYDYSLNNGTLTRTAHTWGNNTNGGMMSCTQEHWPGIDENENILQPTGGVNGSDALSFKNRWTTIEPWKSLASAKRHSQIRAVRCVRDLTAEEADMTYDQIKAHKTN